MKKYYIVPASTMVVMGARESVLAASNFEINTEVVVDDALTTEQDIDPSNWNYWED